MEAEPQRVEQRAGAQHAIVTGELTREIGERIGRIRDGDDHGIGCRFDDLRDDVAVYAGVGLDQLEAPVGVLAIRRAAALLVDARVIRTTPAASRSR